MNTAPIKSDENWTYQEMIHWINLLGNNGEIVAPNSLMQNDTDNNENYEEKQLY